MFPTRDVEVNSEAGSSLRKYEILVRVDFRKVSDKMCKFIGLESRGI